MSRALFTGVGLAALAAVAGALVSQYVFHMEPCAWCVLQRLIFLAIGALALLAAVLPVRLLRGLLGVVIAALGLSGMAAALWQHFVAAKSTSCNLTLADRIVSGLGLDAGLPAVFEPRASCAEAAATLLGVPYEFWSLALFAALAGAALIALRRT